MVISHYLLLPTISTNHLLSELSLLNSSLTMPSSTYLSQSPPPSLSNIPLHHLLQSSSSAHPPIPNRFQPSYCHHAQCSSRTCSDTSLPPSLSHYCLQYFTLWPTHLSNYTNSPQCWRAFVSQITWWSYLCHMKKHWCWYHVRSTRYTL